MQKKMPRYMELFIGMVADPMIKAASATVGVVAVLILTKTIPVVEKK